MEDIPHSRLTPYYKVCLLVGWLLNVPATCECISGTDLLNLRAATLR